VIDHIVALALGGNNDAANLAPACVECNAAKGQVEQRFVARGYDMVDIMRDPDLAGWIKRSLS
jgi:5-methylcytosine-specific restriction protein A